MMSVLKKALSGFSILAASALVLSGCTAAGEQTCSEERNGLLCIGTALPQTGNLAFLGPPVGYPEQCSHEGTLGKPNAPALGGPDPGANEGPNAPSHAVTHGPSDSRAHGSAFPCAFDGTNECIDAPALDASHRYPLGDPDDDASFHRADWRTHVAAIALPHGCSDDARTNTRALGHANCWPNALPFGDTVPAPDAHSLDGPNAHSYHHVSNSRPNGRSTRSP